MNKILSVIVSSNRPEQLRKFFDSFRDKADDPGCFEILVNIDEGDSAMLALLKEAQQSYPFTVRYLQLPQHDGYYTLWIAYQKLLEMADPASYFIWGLSDECRIATQGFDRVMKKYRGFFRDDVFRLKVSRLKYHNYYSYHDCGPCPENFPVYTRLWMKLSGGWGNSWGPDGWHQYIDYYLGKVDAVNGPPGLFRSIPLHELELYGEAAGQGLSPERISERTRRIMQEWQRLYSHASQENFRRIACYMGAYIWAAEAGIAEPVIAEDRQHKQVLLKHAGGEPVRAFSWRINPLYIYGCNFYRIYCLARQWNFPPLIAFLNPSTAPANTMLRVLNKYSRLLLLLLVIRKTPPPYMRLRLHRWLERYGLCPVLKK